MNLSEKLKLLQEYDFSFWRQNQRSGSPRGVKGEVLSFGAAVMSINEFLSYVCEGGDAEKKQESCFQII